MVDISITKLNESFIHVLCTEVHMEMEIQDRFSFEVKDAKYDPRVRSGRWDGIKRLYNRLHKRMYTGLLFDLLKFIKKQGYTYSVAPELLAYSNVELDDIKHVCEELIKPHDNGNPVTLYDYQYDAVHYMLNMNRTICLAATSAGKSLSIYAAIRMYQLSDDFIGKKILVVVPSKMLVEQLYSDFENYSTYEGSNWNVASHCQRFSGDHKAQIKNQIVITTWQSLKNIPNYMITDAGAIFVDECFDGNTPILTPSGYVNIKDLQVGDIIINQSTNGTFKEDEVVKLHTNLTDSLSADMLRVTFDCGKILEVTANHKFLTNKGWMQVGDITDEDIIEYA